MNVKYKLEKNDVFGRYLTASDDIEPGEIILKDQPLIVGPGIKSSLVCVGCHAPLFDKFVICKGCLVAPLCAKGCQSQKGFHTGAECEALIKYKDVLRLPRLMESMHLLTIVRCVILRQNDKEKWDRLIQMETHMEARRGSDIWKLHETKAKIINDSKLLTPEDERNELVQQICGILDVNSFELRINADTADGILFAEPVCGIYCLAALMAHNCVANTHLAIDENFNMTVRSSVRILKGEPIFYNYTHVLQGTSVRREHLREGKYFECQCARCLDGAELGANMSTLKCWNCQHFCLITSISNKAMWECQHCKHQFKEAKVVAMIDDIKNMFEKLDKTDSVAIEKFLLFASNKLHKNHYIMLDAKQALAGLLRDILDRSIQQQKRMLLRKIEICSDFLEVIDVVEPGISRLKAITLYEIHIPIAVLANKDHDAREITSEELLIRLNDAKLRLKEAIRLLLFEPMDSPEGRLCRRAINDMKQLQKGIYEAESMAEKERLELEMKGRRKNRKIKKS